MITNKLTFTVFALIVLFPIYFDTIFLYTITEAGWTFDCESYLHFSIFIKIQSAFSSAYFLKHYQILKLYIMKLLKILSLVCLSISIGACAEHSMSRAKTSTIPQVK